MGPRRQPLTVRAVLAALLVLAAAGCAFADVGVKRTGVKQSSAAAAGGGGGGGTGFAANGVENRCTDLGANCYCSEPFNETGAAAAATPNTIIDDGWNPTDTLPASNFECTDRGGFFETVWLQGVPQSELYTPSIAPYDDSLPNHASNWTRALYQNAAGEPGDSSIWATINGHQPPAGKARLCARYYYTVSQDWGGVQLSGARNKMMELSGENPAGQIIYMQYQENNAGAPPLPAYSGPPPQGATGRPYNNIVGTVGGGPADGNYSFTDGSGTMTYDDCMWAGGRGSCSGDSSYKCFNTAECSAAGKGTCQNIAPPSWCMVEACIACPGSDLQAGGTCHYDLYHRVVAQGREVHRRPPDAPMKNFGNFGVQNWFAGNFDHDSSAGAIIRSMWLVGVWTDDADQRLGCAEEVEGVGCHSRD